MKQYIQRLSVWFSERVFIDLDHETTKKLENQYAVESIRRGKLFKLVILVAVLYSIHIDLVIYQDNSIDFAFRRTLLISHIIYGVLALIYLAFYKMIEASKLYFTPLAKVVLLSDVSMTLLAGSLLSLNSQRYTATIDAYIIIVLAVALVVPMYPRWVVTIYGANHLFFMIGLTLVDHTSAVSIKRLNATTTLLVAITVFLTIYRYHVQDLLKEERLKENSNNYIKLFEANPFPLMISRLSDDRVLYFNERAIQYYEITSDQAEALNRKVFYKSEAELQRIKELPEAKSQIRDYMVEIVTLSGTVKSAMANYSIIDYFGEPALMTGVVDMTEINRLENELKMYAFTDVLTGVLNRRVGMELLQISFEKAQQLRQNFNICFIDIDNLKTVNDEYGHQEGDSLIKRVCQAVQSELQPEDVFFRYGGDEFVILFYQADQQTMQRFCERVRAWFDQLNRNALIPYRVNASIGIFSHKPEMGMSLEEIIEAADRRMYADKVSRKQSAEALSAAGELI